MRLCGLRVAGVIELPGELGVGSCPVRDGPAARGTTGDPLAPLPVVSPTVAPDATPFFTALEATLRTSSPAFAAPATTPPPTTPAAPAVDVPALADVATSPPIGPNPDPGGGATEPERCPPSIIAEYFICAAFWGAPTTVDAPALACDADWAIVATWSPVKCTRRSAIHGEKPATRRINRPVISWVIIVSGEAPIGEPKPPSTPSPITKMMISISFEKTSASMASSHLRTHPRAQRSR